MAAEHLVGDEALLVRSAKELDHDDLASVEARLHIIQGLVAALDRMDEVNSVVRLSSDRYSAMISLQRPPFGFSEVQARHVLRLDVGHQSIEDVEQLREEEGRLRSLLDSLRAPSYDTISVHWFG